MIPYTQIDDIPTNRACSSPYEFFSLIQGKRAFKKDNFKLSVGREYIIFSVFGDRYILRRLKSVEELRGLTKDIREGNVHLIWNETEQQELKQSLAVTYKFYKKEEGSFNYKQYLNIIENTFLTEDLIKQQKLWNNIVGYHTKLRQLEEKQKQLMI